MGAVLKRVNFHIKLRLIRGFQIWSGKGDVMKYLKRIEALLTLYKMGKSYKLKLLGDYFEKWKTKENPWVKKAIKCLATNTRVNF